MHHKKNVESNQTSTAGALVEGALIGGTVGAAHATVTMLSVGAVDVSPLVVASAMEHCSANICNIFEGLNSLWRVAVDVVTANFYLDQIVAGCVSSLGMPEISDNPLLDVIPKCAIGGAVVGGVGYAAYRFFSNQSNQNQQSHCHDRVKNCTP